jgi:hypothetical protein
MLAFTMATSNHIKQLVRGLAFAISAQVEPASLMVLSLCSSAGVHGVFIRLFFAEGCIGESVILGSTAGGGGPEELDGADIGRGVGSDPDARLLFRGPVGDELSGLTDVSSRAPQELDDAAMRGGFSLDYEARLLVPRSCGR